MADFRSRTPNTAACLLQAHEAVLRGHYPAPEENLQVLAALRLQYLQGDYSLHASVPPLEDVYSLQRLKARISQSTKSFTPCERLEKRRTSFLEGTLRRSFRTGSVVRQKAEEEQMLDMWVKEEVSSARANIIDKWKKLQGMGQEQAMAKYMALIKEWPGYGSTLFDVEVRTDGCFSDWPESTRECGCGRVHGAGAFAGLQQGWLEPLLSRPFLLE